MTRWRRAAEGVHLSFLGLWLGALVMIGAGAPLVFITMRDSLDPFLPQYAGYQGPHYLIAGGMVVHRLFMVCDGVQGACAVGAGLALAWVAGVSKGFRGLNALRTLLLLCAAAVLLYRFYVLDPRLHEQLVEYWGAAEKGDGPAAARLREVYDAGHRFERMLFGVTAALVLAMIGTGWFALARREPVGER